MGALHEGHLSLVNAAALETDIVVVSVFINPIQFNSEEDYNKYPNTLSQDIDLLSSSPTKVLFAPTLAEMYSNALPTTSIHFGQLEEVLEGRSRKGHFNGVAIVLSKLFNIIKPNKLFMGAKDFQQCVIVQQLIEDLAFPIELKIMPTLRAQSGLALSSRNKRLSEEGLEKAALIYEKLKNAKERLLAGKDIHEVFSIYKIQLEAIGIYVEYISLNRTSDLSEFIDLYANEHFLLSTAVWLENVRLIDNIEFRT
ncbi:MAG: Pantothenate synthetase [candidate division WS2 bacterium]|uniref:Pantothenate synthetase n=1 Tax=Psychracetigena formicireducens TaxID=2986056 RepID=A0A9E2BID6_PSYF1|nr:Pantothenate synthetase [Candidatus Psychracetigena formicireducens]